MPNLRKALARAPLWALAAVLFAACTLVYGLWFGYPKSLAVYSDELRYLHEARSLAAGQGLVVRGLASDYQKILYPLCLWPAMLCKTTAGQLRAVIWLNAAWMASAVFPVLALARATGQNRRRTVFLLLVTAVLPTMSAAATLMSETVFLPLALWQVWLLLRALQADTPRARAAWCAAAGVWCYALYLNKEVALYFLIAYLLTRWFACLRGGGWRGELPAEAALLGAFALCFALGKLTLFRGLGNSYNQTGWPGLESVRFLPFALVCDLLWAVLAFGVFAVLVPLVSLRLRRPEKTDQFTLFLLLCFAVGVAVAAWSITIREDLGSASPRQHTRYIEPLLLPLLAVTMNALDRPLSAARRRALAVLTAVWGVGFLALCRAIGQGANDNTLLQWFDFVADRLDRLPGLSLGGWLPVWRAAVAAGAAALCFLLLKRRTPACRRALAAGLLAVWAFSLWGEARINRWTYEIDAAQVTAASALNDALKALDGTVLFVAAEVRGPDSRLVDTYIDRDIALCEYPELVNAGFLDDNTLNLADEHPAPEYPALPYTDLTRADYILAADGVPLDTAALLPTDVACPAGFTLYQNPTPEQVRFLP